MKKRTINGKVYVITPEEQEKTCIGCAFLRRFDESHTCPYVQPKCENGMIFKVLEPKETKKPDLKPFNLEAAKQGKPVCTRDGKKARIICFDRKFYNDEYNYPIVAMVNYYDNDNELVHAFTQDGLLVGNTECELDLMMLPEKKEGWINVHKSKDTIFSSKEEAELYKDNFSGYITTTKIEWEE